MRWQPVRYNGSTIHGTAYAARSAGGALDMLNMPSSEAVIVSRGLDTNGAYAGANYQPREFSILFERKGTSGALPTAAQFGDMVETLKGIFYPPQQGTLIVQDIDDSNKEYYILCSAHETPNIAYPAMDVRFLAADPRYYTNAAATATANLTSSPGTITVTVNGNTASQPVIRITPTGTKTGDYGYKIPIVTYFTAGTAVTGYPVDLATDTDTGVWSTTAAVSGGTIQADGDDVRIMAGGAEIDRWLGGMNSGTTRVWANLDYKRYTAMIVRDAVSAAGTPAFIQLQKTDASETALRRMTTTGEVYNPATGERMTYSARSPGVWRLTPQYRGVKGSSAGTIPAGGTLIWLDNPDVWLYYSNTSATAPETDDTRKPIFNLLTTTNVSWDYDEFTDGGGNRAGAWTPGIIRATSPTDADASTHTGRQTRTYTGDHSGTADPAEEMGLVIASWRKNGVWKAEDAIVAWSWSNPVGGTAVTVTGEKYIFGVSWPGLMGLQVSKNGSNWKTIWDEAIPGTASSYANLTANGSAYSLGGVYPYMRIVADGGISAAGSAQAAIEISDLLVALNQPTAPVVKRGAITANYMLNLTIKNETTGKGMSLSGLIALNQTVVIDCAAQTVTYEADGTDMQGGFTLDSGRLEWLDLQPGANVITYTDTGMGNLTLQVITRDEMV